MTDPGFNVRVQLSEGFVIARNKKKRIVAEAVAASAQGFIGLGQRKTGRINSGLIAQGLYFQSRIFSQGEFARVQGDRGRFLKRVLGEILPVLFDSWRVRIIGQGRDLDVETLKKFP